MIFARRTFIVIFLTYMGGCLVGCQIKNQGFSFGKLFVPQTVLWYKLLVEFFGGEK